VPTRRMLINAQHREELRIAIVTDSRLDNYQVEVAEHGLSRGNIYRGVIHNVQPSLNAAFIDYGAERAGFLAIQDVVADAYYHQPAADKGRPRIEDVLDRGRPIVVQVVKEAEGSKGAALTTNLSLAGRYLVFTPFDDTRGVSRKVEDEETRRRLKDLAAGLAVPKGSGVIVRTNALDQTKATLARDLAALLRLWKQIGTEARKGKGVKLLYSDQDLVLQALRDYLDSSIEEVLVDDDDAFANAEAYMKAFMPRGKTRLIRYGERAPLFAKYDLEPQIDRIYERTVPLPAGGSIVIDRTEALTAIDVNSGRSTRAASQEETALNTNLEAAHEVARQLRLRDIGGLFVVDFIDMRSRKSQGRVEKALRDAMKDDKARSQVGRISSNGLLEINRQRIHQALHLRTHRACPTCGGTGRIASPEMVALNLLRRIEGRATTTPVKSVRVELHPELADALQNLRRQELAALERELDLKVEVIASPRLHRPEHEIEWTARPAGEPRRDQDEPHQVPTPTVRAAQLAVPAEVEAPRTDPRRPQAGADGEGKGSESGEGGRPRRRRRGRRKKGSGGGGSDASSGGATPEASVAADAEGRGHRGERPEAPRHADGDDDDGPGPGNEAPAGAADGSASTDEAKSRPRKRRPRRRRRKGSGAGGAGGSDAGEGSNGGEGSGDATPTAPPDGE
jgi:ribonuclease E